MEFENSILFDTDSYKVSMWKQYPPGTTHVYSYIEARGGMYPSTVFLGAQAFIRNRLTRPITQMEIDAADEFWTAHGEPFNRAGWEYILQTHGGILPLEIKTLDEGGVYPVGTALVSVVNTDPNVPWLTTWMETALLRAVWYPTTVATQSWTIKQAIASYLEKSGDLGGLAFKLHDFGSRGVSSLESAMLGSMAHLVNFMGTDTAIGNLAAKKFYDADQMVGFSIPASEHSTITSWGRGNEALAYKNMLEQFSKEGSVFAVVSDSYDIYHAVDYIWGQELADLIREKKGTLVIRPDSGEPTDVLPRLITSLYKRFGGVKNDKGYIVLNNVRLIWGDGINERSIRSILRVVVDMMGYSADNIAFGMGGALLQIVNRDTSQFAMKCSAAKIYGEWVDVYKDPVTDKGKVSKKGIQDTDQHITRFINGHLVNQSTFAQVRERSNVK